MPYINLKVGQKVHVTVTGVIEENLRAAEGGQFLRLRHGTDGVVLVSTIFIDDDSVDIAFDESEEIPPAKPFPSADELRPYLGCWVAVRDGRVAFSAPKTDAVISYLKDTGNTRVETFFVSEQKLAEMTGAEGDKHKVLGRSVTCGNGCYDPNFGFDCPVHGGRREIGGKP